MTLEEYRQTRCPHGWVDVTQCEPCKTAAERDALQNEVDRLRVAAQDGDAPALSVIKRLLKVHEDRGDADAESLAKVMLEDAKGAK